MKVKERLFGLGLSQRAFMVYRVSMDLPHSIGSSYETLAYYGPHAEAIKGSSFKWTPKAPNAFEEIKSKLTQALVLALACFDKVF